MSEVEFAFSNAVHCQGVSSSRRQIVRPGAWLIPLTFLTQRIHYNYIPLSVCSTAAIMAQDPRALLQKVHKSITTIPKTLS